MGIPTPEELTSGPPIRVCGLCRTDDDKHDGGPPLDISPRSARAQWSDCHRCGKRSRFIYLVDRRETDTKSAKRRGL